MEENFELCEYTMNEYNVFRLESPDDYTKNPEQMGFAIIELNSNQINCTKCHQLTQTIQTWWHNKLPYSYISGEEEGLHIHLCLDCATIQNNTNIILLKNSNNDHNKKNNIKLLEQYEIENEQIEYFKLYRMNHQNKKLSVILTD